MNPSSLAFDLTEQGLVPDIVIRRGIRHLLKQRLNEIHHDDIEKMAADQSKFISLMNQSPIALLTDKANEQHYEVPADLYKHTLGTRLKYSSAYWSHGVDSLDKAEVAGLKQTCLNAEIEDGMTILELGCGWGSLTLWMASQYPNARISAVSNSHSQRKHIEAAIHDLGMDNVNVITSDMNDFNANENHYDRIVSVEMFEHMRNWNVLYSKISKWLKPDGKFFKHIFVHRTTPYAFDDLRPDDWMSRYFFSGGIMPSDDLPLFFQNNLKLIKRSRWDGSHYERTANAWLANMDKHYDELMPIIQQTYGDDNASTWWTRWRIFFMACAELFGYENGQQWYVSHYLFANNKYF